MGFSGGYVVRNQWNSFRKRRSNQDFIFTWTSSNTAVATVDNGVVTAVATGTATITVTTTDGNKTASCEVTVPKADPTAPTGLTAIIGETLADVSLPDGWKWNDPTTALKETGEKSFPAQFTENENYNGKNTDLTVTVADASFYNSDSGKKTYNNSDLTFTFMRDGDVSNTYKYKENFNKAPIKGPGIDRDLNSDEYTVANGSLKLTLMNSFLKTLKPGTYTITVYFIDDSPAHSSSTTFTVPSSGRTDNPDTGENGTAVAICIALMMLAAYGSVYAVSRRRMFVR